MATSPLRGILRRTPPRVVAGDLQAEAIRAEAETLREEELHGVRGHQDRDQDQEQPQQQQQPQTTTIRRGTTGVQQGSLPEDEAEEEALLDEQKIFQSLHESLEEMKKKYNKSTEFISALFVRVCGDLKLVEKALQGQEVPQWTYLEDLALTKAIDT